MFIPILYKEWIKTYRIILLFSVIIAGSIFGTFIDAKNNMEFNHATSAILYITQMGSFDFNLINDILMVFAIALGVAQFYPEVSNGRIRLFLHLPMDKLKLISVLVFSGILLLIVFFGIITLFYYLILNAYYPKEVFGAIFTKLFPMFLASLLYYLTTMLAFLEPKIIKKALYVILAYYILSIYKPITLSAYYVSDILNYAFLVIILIYILTSYEVFKSYTKGYIK